MDYKFVQLLTTLGMMLCILSAIGNLNYLFLAWTGYSYIQGSFLQMLFGVTGLILLIAALTTFYKVETSL